MDVSSKVVITSAKSALLATTMLIIYFLIYENDFFNEVIMFSFMAFIITFLISTGMIITTMLPFYSFSKSKDPKKIFNKWFPYYAILFFVVLIFFIGISTDLIFIPTIAFVTAMQAWVWFFKAEKNEKKKTIN